MRTCLTKILQAYLQQHRIVVGGAIGGVVTTMVVVMGITVITAMILMMKYQAKDRQKEGKIIYIVKL